MTLPFPGSRGTAQGGAWSMEAHCSIRPAPGRGRRGPAVIVWLLVPILGAASHRSTNFVVEAPTAEIARKVAEQAEVFRSAIARQWLGKEVPAWGTPCPIRVKLTRGEAGGLTSFGFNRGRVSDQDMAVEGRLDRILASSLLHEIT